MRIDEAGHQVEPVSIDGFSTLGDLYPSLCANLIDAVTHDDNRLTGNGNPVFNVNDRYICDRNDVLRDCG